jgi:hypothetical protein
MKKLLTLTIAVLFVMVAASAVFAETATTFEGQYRVRAWSEWNFDKKYNDSDDGQFDGWFDQRFRLTITHTRSEYLKAVVRIDLVEDTWGQGRAMYIDNHNDGRYINWAYLDFTVPSIGNFRVGKFPVSWGHGLTFSLVNPAPEGVEWSNAWGPVALTLLYIKGVDNVIDGAGTAWYNRDTNVYAFHLGITPMENHLVELFFAYQQADDLWGAAMPGPPAPSPTYDANIFYAGLAYTGNIADMIDIKFEGSYIWGDAQGLAGNADADIEGWNIYVDVSYYNDLWRLGLAFLMVSGDTDDQSGDKLNITSWVDEDFAWANIIGNDGGGTNSIYASWWTGDGLANVTSVKLYFEICPMDKLTINAAVLYAWATEDVGPTGDYSHPAWGYKNITSPWAQWADDDELGLEIDLGFSYEIMDGLTYTFAGGVLFAGDAWDYLDASGHENWGTIWSLSHTLMYEF